MTERRINELNDLTIIAMCRADHPWVLEKGQISHFAITDLEVTKDVEAGGRPGHLQKEPPFQPTVVILPQSLSGVQFFKLSTVTI